ncbi:MAG: protein-methionine-sulfoxide reductase heme-binding subunit MsrQ [Gemmobacter sp.]
MTVSTAINGALRPVPQWALYLAGAAPAAILVVQLFTGGLGVDPVKALEHALGLYALQFLIAGLAITPLRRLTGINLVRWRRALGLIGFGYVALHLAVWVTLDLQFRWGEIGADIVKRPYITVGMLGFALLVPLAWTSSDGAIRRLGGAAWRRLHWLVYPAVLAGAIHYVWLVKAWPIEPILYLGTVLALLGLRVWWWARRRA